MNAYEQRARDLDALLAPSELERQSMQPTPSQPEGAPMSDIKDLVQRMRNDGTELGWSERQRAADTIERLTAERDALLRDIQTAMDTNGGPIDTDETVDGHAYVMVRRDAFDALAARTGSKT